MLLDSEDSRAHGPKLRVRLLEPTHPAAVAAAAAEATDTEHAGQAASSTGLAGLARRPPPGFGQPGGSTRQLHSQTSSLSARTAGPGTPGKAAAAVRPSRQVGAQHVPETLATQLDRALDSLWQERPPSNEAEEQQQQPATPPSTAGCAETERLRRATLRLLSRAGRYSVRAAAADPASGAAVRWHSLASQCREEAAQLAALVLASSASVVL